MAFTAWTPAWWVCVVGATTAAIATGANIIWPYLRNRDGAIDQRMTSYEVVHYLADESAWGELTRSYSVEDRGMMIRKNVLLEAPGEFKRLAEQGKIRAFGRMEGTGQHVEIPSTYWMSAALNMSALENCNISEATPAVPNPGVPSYTDVIVNRAMWSAHGRGRKRWRDSAATTSAHAQIIREEQERSCR